MDRVHKERKLIADAIAEDSDFAILFQFKFLVRAEYRKIFTVSRLLLRCGFRRPWILLLENAEIGRRCFTLLDKCHRTFEELVRIGAHASLKPPIYLFLLEVDDLSLMYDGAHLSVCHRVLGNHLNIKLFCAFLMTLF